MTNVTRRKAAAAIAIAILLKKKKSSKKRKRSVWVKPWLQRRPTLGAYDTLLKEFQLADQKEFEQFLRLSPQLFEELLQIVEPFLKKQNTVMRDSLSPKLKVAATLRFLATGACYSDLQHLFRVHKSTLSKIIPETCEIIYRRMKDKYLKVSECLSFKKCLQVYYKKCY